MIDISALESGTVVTAQEGVEIGFVSSVVGKLVSFSLVKVVNDHVITTKVHHISRKKEIFISACSFDCIRYEKTKDRVRGIKDN